MKIFQIVDSMIHYFDFFFDNGVMLFQLLHPVNHLIVFFHLLFKLGYAIIGKPICRQDSSNRAYTRP